MKSRLYMAWISGWMVIGLSFAQVACSQDDAKSDEFSFEHLSVLEQAETGDSAGKISEKVTENATNGAETAVSAEKSVSDANLQEKRGVFGGDGREFNMWRAVGTLLIILGALFLVSKWLQGRLPKSMGGVGGAGRMKVVERLTVDHRRQLLLISVDDDRELVVALSPTQIESVASWKKSAGVADAGEVEA